MALSPRRAARARWALPLASLAGLSALALPASASTPGRGTASLSAKTIVSDALKALGAAKTLRIAGTIHTGAASVTLDVESVTGGARASGVMRSSTQQLGFVGSLAFIHLDGASYVKADKAFWRSASGKAPAARVVNALANRWIHLDGKTGSELSASLQLVTSPAALAGSLLSSARSAKQLTKERPTRLGDREVVPVRSSVGGTLYVAATGAPLPLEIAKPTGADSGTLVFSYPRTVRVGAPSGAKSFSALAG